MRQNTSFILQHHIDNISRGFQKQGKFEPPRFPGMHLKKISVSDLGIFSQTTLASHAFPYLADSLLSPILAPIAWSPIQGPSQVQQLICISPRRDSEKWHLHFSSPGPSPTMIQDTPKPFVNPSCRR
jgi:hypothetical protein